MRNNIIDDYFMWLSDLVCKGRYSDNISYEELLLYLHSKAFRFTVLRDENRAEDGLDLRSRFADEWGYPDAELYLKGPCSVLEMMVALALRCEECIMDDPHMGNRTKQWFWRMIVNLGLGSMSDDRFDEQYVEDVVERFLDREYEPDGQGGLFTIRDCEYDLRFIEIWHQLLWYLDTIT
jgi:hypothetical protein